MLTYFAPYRGSGGVSFTDQLGLMTNEWLSYAHDCTLGKTPSDSYMFAPGILKYEDFAPGGMFGV